LYADYGIRDEGENVYSGGYKGDNWNIGVRKEEGGDPTFGFNWKKKFNQGGRIGLFGGGKAANWFIKNFKSLIDEAANPGPWSRFSKMGAKDKQAAIADAKEMIKNLEAGDPIPEYLLEDIVANPKF
jgi:hypothetical protein